MRVIPGEVIFAAALAGALYSGFPAAPVRANPGAGRVKEGNRYYAAGKYEQALSSYGAA
jgi:hypothetical protein